MFSPIRGDFPVPPRRAKLVEPPPTARYSHGEDLQLREDTSPTGERLRDFVHHRSTDRHVFAAHLGDDLEHALRRQLGLSEGLDHRAD